VVGEEGLLTDNLKPCPFCGGTADLITGKVPHHGFSQEYYKVRCRGCGLDVAWFLDESEKELNPTVKAWNRRASD